MAKLTLEKFLPYRLNRLAALISHDFRGVYGANHDLTIPEWRVLATLGEFEEMTAKAIGKHSSMHKTKVSRAVQALEDRRWLTRTPSGTDRREEYLRLTALGKQTYSDIVPRALAFEAKILVELGGEGTAVLDLLSRLEIAANSLPSERGDM
ncbi:MarR family transcriptional regulator [Agrobacterium sp. 13-626]|nr:MarR family transcriptional regulator [Agrobacterium sp. 13-626]